MEDAKEGVKITGRTLNNLRHADEKTLMAGKEADLKKTDKKAEERKQKAGHIFQHKEDKDYDNSRLATSR